jgi:hypothetical protein
MERKTPKVKKPLRIKTVITWLVGFLGIVGLGVGGSIFLTNFSKIDYDYNNLFEHTDLVDYETILSAEEMALFNRITVKSNNSGVQLYSTVDVETLTIRTSYDDKFEKLEYTITDFMLTITKEQIEDDFLNPFNYFKLPTLYIFIPATAVIEEYFVETQLDQIIIEHLYSDTLKIKASSTLGDITLHDLDVHEVEAITKTGAIVLDGVTSTIAQVTDSTYGKVEIK